MCRKHYLILWRDNIIGYVKIELYQGSKLISVIASKTASDGVFAWITNRPILQGFYIRVTSLEDENVFSRLQLR